MRFIKQTEMSDISNILKIAATTLPLLTSSNEGQKRRSLRMFRKLRRKLFKELKRGGITDEEKITMQEIDSAYVETMISLGKF